jgi:hypothetical protein
MDTLLDICITLDKRHSDDAEFGRHVRSQLDGFRAKEAVIDKIREHDPMFCSWGFKHRVVIDYGRVRKWNLPALRATNIQSLNKILERAKKNEDEATGA